MSDNLYAPPKAELVTPDAQAPLQPFYVVSRGKFITLYIVTFGIYQLYWAYKNWHQFRHASGQDLWPVARAFFAIFFTHALYREADAQLKRDGRSHDWRPGELATLFVVGLIVNNVVDALSRKNIGYPVTDIASLALLPVLAWITWLGQRGLNAAAGDPEGRSNARFTPINYVFIVLGALLLALACIGVMLPPE
ncbi:MAG: DUF4234 domain-containing protein [Pseudomonas protegens]|uniref:DUF4234 domain-containing protein n=1 Tax=Pseudomonas protegens TaxID=380021 RepID=UPI00383B7D5A